MKLLKDNIKWDHKEEEMAMWTRFIWLRMLRKECIFLPW